MELLVEEIEKLHKNLIVPNFVTIDDRHRGFVPDADAKSAFKYGHQVAINAVISLLRDKPKPEGAG